MTDQALRRKQRLAAALRENLKRRKTQQRVRSVQEAGSGPVDTDDNHPAAATAALSTRPHAGER